MPPIPPLTMKLLWAVAAMLILPYALPPSILVQMVMWPLGDWVFGVDSGQALPSFMPWQLLTHVLYNPGVGGVLFVGLTLFFFGSALEATWGERRYGLFLLAVVIGGGIIELLVLSICVRAGWTPFHPVTGASAVMYGILFACAYLDPNRRVMLLIPPIPMKMWVLVAVFTALELLFGIFGSINGVAHVGFLGGMLAAWLHIRYWRGQPPFRPRGPKRPNLRSVN
ncbi:rhomboid family intramembrane serine protease [Arenimonas composti]|uniref:Peptidase S54 rhomboid domain-containing protein n=1 Tax=Arenimonas composti TR7-09 = DSM 18010 TaxID=1121013 RepID=A0A091B9A5_9GAMM|nr:rhomboid family intramembrane serine protease [Arenimonas composti]KFN49243.1 hypothetical protein P873_11805 [Arenimonas composti TR7-09 = DSM 18010]